MYRRNRANSLVGILANIVTFVGFIIEVFTVNEALKWISGIFIVIGLIISVLIFLYDHFNSEIITKQKMQRIGKNVIADTRTSIVLYGGDMSWAKTYKSEISKLIRDKKKVEVVFPKDRESKDNIDVLRELKVDVYYIEHDLGLRFMISDLDERDAVVFLTSKTKSGANVEKYKAAIYTYKDGLIFDSFKKINSLVSQTRRKY